MDRRAAAQLVELSRQYRGKDPDEQNQEMAAALVRIGGGTGGADVGTKDYWLRVRDGLVRATSQSDPATGATVAAIADQVVRWATSSGLDPMAYQIPLAILTAMISDGVISAARSGGQMVQPADEAANFVIDSLSRYRLDDEDKDRLRALVRYGSERYQTETSGERQPFEHYVNELAQRLDEAYAAEYRGETVSLGPLSAHMIAAICPLWPFCT